MLISYNWLKEYIAELPSPKEIAEGLTMSGTEVESVTEKGGGLGNVVTAEILTCGRHPNADRLSLCEVKTDKAHYSIVCGAKNMKAGDRVALALEGAELPGGLKIKRSKIRGVESQGMMCSEVELGLKDTSEGILILPGDTPLGKNITEALGLGDYLLEVSITPNRADLLSVRGVAREISAVFKASFKDKAVGVEEGTTPVEDLAKVLIEKGAPCKRYTARVIKNVKIGPSPDWLKRRLESTGLRSVNNVVDVTNLVLLELGQPLHAFDYDKLGGHSIVVRPAVNGESIETIDGKVRTLETSMLVIADERVPVALAGVMGGKATEVSEGTVNILLESAWFVPDSIRKTSKKTGLSSDSSYRFERGVDIEAITTALDMAAQMIKGLAGGEIAKGIIDIYPEKLAAREIRFRVKKAEETLGTELGAAAIEDIFSRLSIRIKDRSQDALTVVPPSYRGDLREEIDLIEEVARLFGYNNIPTDLPKATLAPGSLAKNTRIKRDIRNFLRDAGFLEVINYSFISRDAFALIGGAEKKGVEIINPLSEDQIIMRDSLMPSLLETLHRNVLKKNEEVRIFEIGPAFLAGGEKLPRENWRVGGLMYGLRSGQSWNQAKDPLDFFDVKGTLEGLFEALGAGELTAALTEDPLCHPGKSAKILIKNRPAGYLGELHPDYLERYGLRRPAYIFELEIDALMEAAGEAKKYSALPRFPESTRDIAFIIDETVPYQEIISSIRKLDTKLIDKIELFDVYYGGNIPPGKRSLAVRVTYRSMERTLTNQEVEDIHARVSSGLVKRFGAEVRGEERNP